MLLVRTLDSGRGKQWSRTAPTEQSRVTGGRPMERLHRLLDAANLPPKIRTGLKYSSLLRLMCGAVVRLPTSIELDRKLPTTSPLITHAKPQRQCIPHFGLRLRYPEKPRGRGRLFTCTSSLFRISLGVPTVQPPPQILGQNKPLEWSSSCSVSGYFTAGLKQTQGARTLGGNTPTQVPHIPFLKFMGSCWVEGTLIKKIPPTSRPGSIFLGRAGLGCLLLAQIRHRMSACDQILIPDVRGVIENYTANPNPISLIHMSDPSHE